MRYLKFIGLGFLFGVLMTKSEAISWYRIQEMFRFDSIHMYGIIGTAVVLGIPLVWLAKRMRNVEGDPIRIAPKAFLPKRLLLGGTIFGLGWALTGACPGPMYVLVGNGFSVFLVVIAAAVLGALAVGIQRSA